MLITAAVLPGPPAFVPELMGSAAHELDDLRDAADFVVSRAVSDLVAAQSDSQHFDVQSRDVQSTDALSTGTQPTDAQSTGTQSAGTQSTGTQSAGAQSTGTQSTDSPTTDSQSPDSQATEPQAAGSPRSTPVSAQLVVVGPGQHGELNAAGPVSFAGFGRDFAVPALVEGARADPDLPTPLMVARYLASRDIAAHPEHAQLWAAARWVTTSGGDATALGEDLRVGGALVALILVADGATCHGPKAPRAQDVRAGAYDQDVCAALASGRPDRLAQVDTALGDELGATGSQLWPVLVAAAGVDGIVEGLNVGADAHRHVFADHSDLWVGEVLWTGAPYGVGWAVASWRRPRDLRRGDQVSATQTRA